MPSLPSLFEGGSRAEVIYKSIGDQGLEGCASGGGDIDVVFRVEFNECVGDLASLHEGNGSWACPTDSWFFMGIGDRDPVPNRKSTVTGDDFDNLPLHSD